MYCDDLKTKKNYYIFLGHVYKIHCLEQLGYVTPCFSGKEILDLQSLYLQGETSSVLYL